MKQLAAALIVFAWLVTTNQVSSIKASGPDTLIPSYQAYCTTQKSLKPDTKGLYKIESGGQTVYVPASSARVETVDKCP